jgi:hypothetical protein
VEYIDRRARRVIPKLFSGQNAEAGFLEWAKNVTAEDLVTATCIVSADGAEPVSRSRGSGKRSAATLQPRTLGRVSGSGKQGATGGRPKHEATGKLVGNLALDWIIATDCAPSPGRSDHGGFGDLVHSVFQWVDEPAPDQALRRHWREVKRGKARSVNKAKKASS